MSFICLNTAIALTGVSKRTLWRRIGDKEIRTQDGSVPGEQTRVAVDDVLLLSTLKLEPEDRELILDADAGQPEAQCDLALMFLGQNQPVEAVRWLEMSASRLCTEAMHWLGRCYIAGSGVPADEKTGTEWIAKAANRGHATAVHMIQHLNDPARPAAEPAELEAALDDIERKVILKVMEETAQQPGR